MAVPRARRTATGAPACGYRRHLSTPNPTYPPHSENSIHAVGQRLVEWHTYRAPLLFPLGDAPGLYAPTPPQVEREREERIVGRVSRSSTFAIQASHPAGQGVESGMRYHPFTKATDSCSNRADFGLMGDLEHPYQHPYALAFGRSARSLRDAGVQHVGQDRIADTTYRNG